MWFRSSCASTFRNSLRPAVGEWSAGSAFKSLFIRMVVLRGGNHPAGRLACAARAREHRCVDASAVDFRVALRYRSLAGASAPSSHGSLGSGSHREAPTGGAGAAPPDYFRGLTSRLLAYLVCTSPSILSRSPLTCMVRSSISLPQPSRIAPTTRSKWPCACCRFTATLRGRSDENQLCSASRLHSKVVDDTLHAAGRLGDLLGAIALIGRIHLAAQRHRSILGVDAYFEGLESRLG
jgi:hypothetical protein